MFLGPRGIGSLGHRGPMDGASPTGPSGVIWQCIPVPRRERERERELSKVMVMLKPTSMQQRERESLRMESHLSSCHGTQKDR